MSHHHKLHEFAKFLSGLVLGDFICSWWLYAAKLLPVHFIGANITVGMIMPWMIFDAALFIVLVHYGWHIGKTPTLSRSTFFVLVGIILGAVALAHLIRLFFGVDIVIAGWTVPLWLSWIGTAVAAYLSYMSFHLSISKIK
ncbi:MAG: hypothetical protein KGJ35_01255 [Patescibacteria group bacterium]|nr:hypothetical protein [Patescibacteria group bacterium]